MKKMIKYIAVITLASLMGCQKEYITYTSSQSGIFFESLTNSTNTTSTLAFGLIPSTTISQVKEIKVTLVGQLTDYDREFTFVAKELTEDFIVKNGKDEEIDRYKPALAVRPDGTADYKILTPNPIIPAGGNVGIVKVEFFRNDLLHAKETRMIDFELKENNNFVFLYPINPSDVLTTRLSYIINEKITEPWWWRGNDELGLPIFGEYTELKSLMIADKYLIDRNKWTNGNLADFGGLGRLKLVALQFQLFLNEEKEAGRTIYEEDGKTEMIMGEFTLDQI